MKDYPIGDKHIKTTGGKLIFVLTKKDISPVGRKLFDRVSIHDFKKDAITIEGMNKAYLVLYSDGNRIKVLKDKTGYEKN